VGASGRVRDDLLRYGLVSAGAAVRLRHDAAASLGDLIVARKNDRRIIAGTPGRGLANRDVLRVDGVTGPSVTVRRLARRDTDGRAVWTAPFELPKSYLFSHCDLAYATTPHAAQGRTVDTAHVLVDRLGDRQALYVAVSRGREANYAYCVTGFPRAADTREGSRPAPELARMRRLTAERTGSGPGPAAGPDKQKCPERDAVSVLAEVMSRDGAVLSATETLASELSNADHLGALGAIWYDLARRAQATRFEQELHASLPAAADAALSDPACTWLWRSLREAEAAGLDGGQVLRDAIAVRSLTGARHEARAVDRHGHAMFEDCPERDVACSCRAVGRCLQGSCPLWLLRGPVIAWSSAPAWKATTAWQPVRCGAGHRRSASAWLTLATRLWPSYRARSGHGRSWRGQDPSHHGPEHQPRGADCHFSDAQNAAGAAHPGSRPVRGLVHQHQARHPRTNPASYPEPIARPPATEPDESGNQQRT